MKLSIEVDNETGKEEITFSNDNLNNTNFVDMYIGEKEYTICLNDLEIVTRAFVKYKKLYE